MTETLIKTNYLVSAASHCSTCNKVHSLTGTGSKKGDVQPLIKDVVNDLALYQSEQCVLGDISGTFVGTQDIYAYIDDTGSKHVRYDPVNEVNKVYLTKKAPRQ